LTGPDVAEDVELAESVSMAMVTVLQTLEPMERAVFVLREVFDMPYGEIAEAMGGGGPDKRTSNSVCGAAVPLEKLSFPSLSRSTLPTPRPSVRGGRRCWTSSADKPGRAVVGVNISPEMLAMTRQRVAGRGLHSVTFREGRGEALPVDDARAQFRVASHTCAELVA